MLLLRRLVEMVHCVHGLGYDEADMGFAAVMLPDSPLRSTHSNFIWKYKDLLDKEGGISDLDL